MNFRTVQTVIAREYMTRVKKKSFLLTTFLVPVIMAAAMVAMVLIMSSGGERSQKVAVIDQSGIVMPYMTDNKANTFLDFSTENPEEFKLRLDEFAMDVLVVVSPLDTVAKTVSVQAYSKKPLGVDFSSEVASRVDDAVEAYRIDSYGIENLGQIMKDVSSHVSVSEFTLDESGNESVSESGVYMTISMVLGIFIFMFITMFGSMVMSSVIEEKASRVVEVLISSAKATELMFGKIIGVALVALTQFLLWIVLTLVIVTVVGGVIGMDKLQGMDTQQVVQMSQGMGMDPAQMEALGIPAADTAAVAAPAGEMGVVVSTLAHVPWGTMIVCFFIYFILGYLLYASLFAAIGSAVENEADTGQLQIPLTIPLMIGYMIVFMAFRNPDAGAALCGSMIPFTSPIVMLARIPYGVPVWQLVVSIALLFLTFVACAWLSAKIYKVGILMFGKKSTFKDLWKWLKQN